MMEKVSEESVFIRVAAYLAPKRGVAAVGHRGAVRLSGGAGIRRRWME